MPLAVVCCVAPAAVAEDAVAQRGEALYRGGAPLVGRIAGHSAPLPPLALVCINCHGATGDTGQAAVAPPLVDGWLRRQQSRRNGPVSAYDEPALCRALRTGIDPVDIRLPLRMPRYALSDDDCAALWMYLDAAR